MRALQADVQQLEFKVSQLTITSEEDRRATTKTRAVQELAKMKRVAEFAAVVKRRKNRVRGLECGWGDTYQPCHPVYRSSVAMC